MSAFDLFVTDRRHADGWAEELFGAGVKLTSTTYDADSNRSTGTYTATDGRSLTFTWKGQAA